MMTYRREFAAVTLAVFVGTILYASVGDRIDALAARYVPNASADDLLPYTEMAGEKSTQGGVEEMPKVEQEIVPLATEEPAQNGANEQQATAEALPMPQEPAAVAYTASAEPEGMELLPAGPVVAQEQSQPQQPEAEAIAPEQDPVLATTSGDLDCSALTLQKVKQAQRDGLIVTNINVLGNVATLLNSTHCSLVFTFVAYKVFTSDLAHQTVFDSVTKTVNPGERIGFEIRIPNCAYQTDLRYGNTTVRNPNNVFAGRINTNLPLCHNDDPAPPQACPAGTFMTSAQIAAAFSTGKLSLEPNWAAGRVRVVYQSSSVTDCPARFVLASYGSCPVGPVSTAQFLSEDSKIVMPGTAVDYQVSVTSNATRVNLWKVLSSAPRQLSDNQSDPMYDNLQAGQLINQGVCPVTTITPLLSKTLLTQNPKPGDTVTYQLRVTNPSATVDLQTGYLHDYYINSNMSFVSWDGSTFCSLQRINSFDAGESLVCTLGTLPAGQTYTYNVRMKVADNPSNCTIKNQASAGGTNATPVFTPILTTTLTNCPVTGGRPVLQPLKTVQSASVTPGGTIVYRISAKNTGSATANSVLITDYFSSTDAMTYQSSRLIAGRPDAAGSCDIAAGGRSIICRAGTVQPQEEAVYEVTFRVSDNPPQACIVQNSIGVTGKDSAGGDLPTQLSPMVSTVIQNCPVITRTTLEIVKTSERSDVQVNDTVTYQIRVTNRGTVATTGTMRVDDFAPLNLLQFVSGEGCSVQGSYISCQRSIQLQPQSGTSFFLTFRVLQCGDIRNTAQVSVANADPAMTLAPTLVRALCAESADVAVTKTGPQTAAAGSTVSYTIAIRNNGPDAARNVLVADQFNAPGATLVSSLPSECVASTIGFGCNFARIEAGATRSFTVTYQLASATACGTSVRNEVQVANSVSDPVMQNNIASVVTQVTCQPPVITVLKSVDKTLITRGDSLTYTIRVRNTGGSDATGVTVSDQLPSTVSVVSVSNGCSVSAGNLMTCGPFSVQKSPVPADGSKDVILTAIVSTQPATGSCANATLVNTATALMNGSIQHVSNQVSTTLSCPALPSLTLTKSASVQNITRGQGFSYTLIVRNTGTVPAQGVTLTDALPDAFTLTSGSTPGCSQAGQIVTCAPFTLAAGEVRSITLAVSVPAVTACSPFTARNTASVIATGLSAITSNEVLTSVLCPLPLLSIEKSGPVTAQFNTPITYTITVRNDGNADATNVTVADFVPQGLTFSPAMSTAGCALVASTVQCANLTVARQSSLPIILAFATPQQSNPCTQRQVSNTASVRMGVGALISSNTVITTLTCADTSGITIIKNANASSVMRGTSLTYTLTVSNTGNTDLTNVVVTDPFPQGLGLSFNALLSTPGCTLSFLGGSVSCSLGTLSTQSPVRYVTLSFNVGQAIPCTPQLASNIASVSAQGVPSVSSNTVQTTIECPAIVHPVISGQKSGPLSAVRGEKMTYTIAVSNTGDGRARGVRIVDFVPSGLGDFIESMSTQGCKYDPQNHLPAVVCTLGDLTPGASRIVSLVFDVPLAQTQCVAVRLDNTARIEFGRDADSVISSVQTNTVSTTLSCPALPSLTLTKSASVQNITRGQGFSYTLIVRNTGTVPAQGVTLTDALPDAFTLTSGSTPGCSQAGQIVTCAPFTLAAGEVRSITLAVSVPAVTACSPFTARNTASVIATGLSAITSNEVLTSVLCPLPLLSIEKSGPSTVQAGTLITYILTVRNDGTGQATGVTVSDSVPSGLTFNAAASSSSCALNGSSVQCSNLSLPPQSSLPLTLAFNVPAQPCPRTITNTASVRIGNGNPTSSNTVTTSVSCPSVTGLTIVKNGDATVMRGNTLTYTLTVSNTGNTDLTNVVVTDAFPSDLQFNAAQSSLGCTQNGGSISCAIGTVNTVTPRFVTLTFNVPLVSSCLQKNITNIAKAMATGISEVTSNVVTTTLLCPVVGTPSISGSKSAPSTVYRGSVLTYVLSVQNTGTAVAKNVKVIDAVPSSLGSFIPAQSSTGCVSETQNGSPVVVCTSGDLMSGQSRQFFLSFNVPTLSGTCTTGTATNVAAMQWNSEGSTVVQSAQTNTTSTSLQCPETGGGSVTIINTNTNTFTPSYSAPPPTYYAYNDPYPVYQQAYIPPPPPPLPVPQPIYQQPQVVVQEVWKDYVLPQTGSEAGALLSFVLMTLAGAGSAFISRFAGVA